MKSQYDKGYDKGHDIGYTNGFNEGFTWGKRSIIPESFGQGFNYAWSFSDRQKKRVTNYLNKLKKQMQPDQAVAKDIKNALAKKSGLSIIRIGDGELMVMAQKTMSTKLIKLRGHMLWKHLNKIPDYDAQELVVKAMYKADWIGMPFGRGFPDCDIVLGQIMLDKPALKGKLTHSVINYRLAKHGYLADLMKDKRIITIGNTADDLKVVLCNKGYNCIKAISPVKKLYDLDRVFSIVADIDFDIALVAAGVAAVPLCVKIASSLKKVAIDFGHMSDELLANKNAM